MEPELKAKVRLYADNAYLAKSRRISDTARKKLEELAADLARRGVSNSGFGYRGKLEIEAERIREYVLAQAEGLIDGYEIHDVPLDGDILKDVSAAYFNAISGIANGMKGEMAFHAQRTGANPEGASNFTNNIKQNLEQMTHGVLHEVRCMVDQRRVRPKLRPQSSLGNVTITGPNARLNYHSTDQSVNTVTVTQDQLFVQIREAIKADVPAPDQEQLMQRLEAVESAVNKPTVRERYREFVALAADYATLLPFIPKLLALVQHAVQSM